MHAFSEYIANDRRDKWVEIGCPVLIFCMFVAIYFIPSLNSYEAFKSYLESTDGTAKIFISILPSQVLFLAGQLLAAFFASRQTTLREKLGLINWRSAYIPQAFKLELVLIFPILLTAALSFYTMKYFGYDFSSSPILEFLKKADTGGIIVIFIFSVFVAPVIEEIAFRRVVFTFLARIFGSTPSILLTSFVFACMHGGFVQLIPLFILSLALQHLYIKNNSLFPSILLHCFHNTIVMLLFIISKTSLHL